ncbi:MAG: YHS domain-containing protein [Owenweeksia sp.]
MSLTASLLLAQASCSASRMNANPGSAVYIDPVCGSTVKQDTKWYFSYEERIYYFESEECKLVFQKDPARFAQNQPGHNSHKGLGKLGWWGPVMAGIMVLGMTSAMILGLNH